MIDTIDLTLYSLGQLLLLPVFLVVLALFVYAFFSAGALAWQAWQRYNKLQQGFELIAHWRIASELSDEELELLAYRRLEVSRIGARVAPMLGLVATMVPMGPALRALGNGQLADMSDSLAQAFSAVIIALIAASLIYVVHNVRRRWYLDELCEIKKIRAITS